MNNASKDNSKNRSKRIATDKAVEVILRSFEFIQTFGSIFSSIEQILIVRGESHILEKLCLIFSWFCFYAQPQISACLLSTSPAVLYQNEF